MKTRLAVLYTSEGNIEIYIIKDFLVNLTNKMNRIMQNLALLVVAHKWLPNIAKAGQSDQLAYRYINNDQSKYIYK